MPLEDYSPADEAFFRTLDSRASRMTGELPPDADGGLQASGWGGHDKVQADDFTMVQHYGFRSTPPADAEYVRQVGDPDDCSVAERVDAPAGLPSRATGDSLIYGPSGNSFVHCDGSGNVVVTAAAGKKTVISAGGSTKAVTIDGDPCPSSVAFDEWAAAIEAALILKQNAFEGAPTTVIWSSGANIAETESTSTTLEAE